jgi:hypothetical protein
MPEEKNSDGNKSGSQENIKVAAPVVDAAYCAGCEFLNICSAIVPGGPWNPAPGNGVKACPGVR